MIIVVTGFFLMVFPAKLWHRLIRSLPLISPFELPSAALPRADPSSGGAGNLEHWPRWDHTLFPNNRALITCVGWHEAF